VLTRKEFVRVVNNATLGMGFAQGIAKVVFPVDLFLVESDLSPINENIDQFIEGLTKWAPTVQGKTIIKPPMITIEGKDYEEAFANMNKLFLAHMWGDGLPLLPATLERVNWILRGTDLSPDTNLGKILPKGRIARWLHLPSRSPWPEADLSTFPF
jgi:hypothetical protein